jgi:hypothetical protein
MRSPAHSSTLLKKVLAIQQRLLTGAGATHKHLGFTLRRAVPADAEAIGAVFHAAVHPGWVHLQEVAEPALRGRQIGSSSRPPVTDVRGERRVEYLDRLEPEGLDSVEQALAGPEQDGDR